MNFLTETERNQLKLQHKRERDGRIRDRIKALILYDEGWSPKKIATVLLISDEAVRNHIEEYQTSKKLRLKSGGSTEKLSADQSQKLEAHLQVQVYLYVKDVVAYVEATFGVSYTVHGMRNWLQRHSFSYKNPGVVPGKANKEQQQKWLAQYDNLRVQLGVDETACFTDRAHPTHPVQPAYRWIKKGIRKEILANTRRGRVNLSKPIDVFSHNIAIVQS